jgi:predicted dinucleotide-utilizing enzyme
MDQPHAGMHCMPRLINPSGASMTMESVSANEPSRNEQWSLERINRLVFDLEQELAKAPAQANVERMRAELQVLREALNAHAAADAAARDAHMETARSSFGRMTAAVENEVLRESSYIAELGRILGMV